MENKTLSELYEQGLLSETQEDKLLHTAFQLMERERIKSVMRQEAKTIQLQRNRWLAVAACILLGVIGLRFFPQFTTSKTPKLFLEEVSAPASASKPLLGEPQISLDSVLHRFNEAYDAKRYAECLQVESKIAVADANYQILLAYCYLKTNNYSKSIELLEKLYLQSEDSHEEIHWWLGLSYGLAGDKPNMKKYLSKIAPKQFNYQAAQSLLQ